MGKRNRIQRSMPNMKGGNPLDNPEIQEQLETIGSVTSFKQVLMFCYLNTLAERTGNGFIPLSQADGTDETENKIVYDENRLFEFEGSDELDGKYYSVVMEINYKEEDEKPVPERVTTYCGEKDIFEELCKGIKILAFISDTGKTEENYIQITHSLYTDFSIYLQNGKYTVI